MRQWIDEYLQYISAQSSLLDQRQREGKSYRRRQSHYPPVVRPDIVALGTVVHAWVESGLPNAPIAAEDWLQLWEYFEQEEQQIQLNLTEERKKIIGLSLSKTNNIAESRKKLYAAVLLAWARAGNPNKAKEWIDRMIAEKEFPGVLDWNCLLMAYQRSALNSDNNVAEQAEQVLRHMQSLYYNNGGGGGSSISKNKKDSNIQLSSPPNLVSYGIVIDTWTKRTGLLKDANRRRGKNRQESNEAIKAAQIGRAHV